MNVMDDYINRRWLIVIGIVAFALQVLISQRISLFIPSGEVSYNAQSPQLVNFQINLLKEYKPSFYKINNSKNIFHTSEKYIFALVLSESLLFLLVLGGRLRWIYLLPIPIFPGLFTNSLEGLIFGGVTNWIHIQVSGYLISISLGDACLFFGVIFHLYLLIKITRSLLVMIKQKMSPLVN